MRRWDGPIDFDKYYGHYSYKEKVGPKKEFSEKEKDDMFKEIFIYLKENNYKILNQFLEDICDTHNDWCNYVYYDREVKRCLLTCLTEKNTAPYRRNLK